MDHIPDEDGIRLNCRVPYLIPDVSFDGGDWDTFPARCGYPWLSFEKLTVQNIQRHERRHTQQQLQALVQTWLYFGPLETLLDRPYRRLDSLNMDQAGSTFLSTETALWWQVDWTPGSYAGFARPTDLIKHVMMASTVFDQYAKNKDRSWAELLLCIKLLIEFLLAHMMPDRYFHFMAQPGAAADLLRSYLLQNTETWCVHQVDSLCAQLSYSTLLYLTGIKRYQRPGVDHTRCLAQDTCKQYSINTKDHFETSHLNDACQCEHVEAPGQERTEILRQGGIPVLHCTFDDDGELALHFVRASPHLSYVAISHLWADGLGNPVGNSLPRCQLLQLMGFIRDADQVKAPTYYSRHMMFWLDVYCIPLGPFPSGVPDPRSSDEQAEDLRLKREAIARMDATYAWARYVLALDQETMRQTLRYSSPAKKHALVAINAWNMRCWTYQEHALARVTMFQGYEGPRLFAKNDQLMFEDATIVHLCRDLSRLYQTPALNAYAWLRQDHLQGRPERDLEEFRTNDRYDFLQAWNVFSSRTTSQWEDMIVIFANLLDLNATRILQLDRALQMKAVLAAQRTLPLGLFLVGLRRLGNREQQGKVHLDERWVPETLQNVLLPGEPMGVGKVTAKGILIENVGPGLVLLRMDSLPISQSPIKFTWDSGYPLMHNKFWLSLDHDEADARLHGKQKQQKAFLLLEITNPLLGRDLAASFRGALLQATGPTKDGKMPVAFIGNVQWGCCHQEDVMAGPSNSTRPTNRDVSDGVVEAHPLSSSHPSFLIVSDIASWPKIQNQRSRPVFSMYRAGGNHLFVWLPATCASSAIFMIPVYLFFKQYGDNVMNKIYGYGMLGLAVTAFVVRIWALALRYPIMYSMQSEVARDHAWWRQLTTALDDVRVLDAPWFDWICVAAMKLALAMMRFVGRWAIFPAKRAVTQMGKVLPLGRNRSVQLPDEDIGLGDDDPD